MKAKVFKMPDGSKACVCGLRLGDRVFYALGKMWEIMPGPMAPVPEDFETRKDWIRAYNRWDDTPSLR